MVGAVAGVCPGAGKAGQLPWTGASRRRLWLPRRSTKASRVGALSRSSERGSCTLQCPSLSQFWVPLWAASPWLSASWLAGECGVSMTLGVSI